MLLTILMAYPLSRREFFGRNVCAFYVFFTMLFNGGLVPTYIMYTRYLHIKNTLWALLIPSLLVSAFYVIMMRTYFNTNIPEAVIEAARIDGAGEWRILFTIVLPMSLPMIATMALLIGLGYWNDWKNGLYYLTDSRLYSIQNMLNQMLKDIQFLKSGADVLCGGRPCPGHAERRHQDGDCRRRRPADHGRLPLLPEVLCQGHHDRRGQGLSCPTGINFRHLPLES